MSKNQENRANARGRSAGTPSVGAGLLPGNRPNISGRAINPTQKPPTSSSRPNLSWAIPSNQALAARFIVADPNTPGAGGVYSEGAAQVVANQRAIRNYPVGGDDFGGSGPAGGGGYGRPAPLVLPRMALPAPELLAKQAFLAVGAATQPYIQAIEQLAQQRAEGDKAITAADREASTANRQIQQDWQRRTAGVEGNIANVYRDALSQLASVVADNNMSMASAGFRPADTGGNAALGRLAGLGGAAREAALVRQQLGADAFRDQRQATAGVTQAGRGALASTYAQVLGSLRTQQAAAEAAARFEQFNREMALRQEIDRINYDASVQEAMANR